jgi:hypothetical protein
MKYILLRLLSLVGRTSVDPRSLSTQHALVDTSGEDDIHINDILVEQFAQYSVGIIYLVHSETDTLNECFVK